MKPISFLHHTNLVLAIGAFLLAQGPVGAQLTNFPERVAFDAAQGQIPEGVAVDQEGNVFVSFGADPAARGQILKFSPSGQPSVFTEMESGLTGLIVDACGDVLAAAPGRGVYRVDCRGQAVLVPGTELIVAANALAFDERGNLYITESFSFDPPLIAYPGCNTNIPAFGRGGIWRVPAGGVAELWLRDDLLTGTCPLPFLTTPFGANGIAYHENALYVINTDRGTIVAVPVLTNGAPGTLSIAAQMPNPDPAAPLTPAGDGIAVDVQGNFYVAMPSHTAIVRISPDGQSWQTIATAADGLDMPVSLAFGSSETARRQLFVTSMAMIPGGAGPSLLKVAGGTPGAALAPAMEAPGSWTRKADMPMPVAGGAACAVDGILYVVGGDTAWGSNQLRTLFAYDPQTDTWTRKADMPSARHWPAACALDGKIYVIGGGGFTSVPSSAVEAYDPQANTWQTKAPLSAPRSGVAACAVNGLIYAIGGLTGAVGSHPTWLAVVEAYNPVTDQWTPRASLPIPAAMDHGAHYLNGLIYFVSKANVFAYDPTGDRWTRTPIPSGYALLDLSAVGSVNGIVYAFGGESSHVGATTVLACDVGRQTFSLKRMIPFPSEDACCAAIDGRIYFAGGLDRSPLWNPSTAVFSDDLWVFNPQGGLRPRLLGVARQSADAIRLCWQGEPGRRYGMESRVNAASGIWRRSTFSGGDNILQATDRLVEGTVIVPTTDNQRFFRALEMN